MSQPITAILTAFYSKPDKFGNTKWAFRFVETSTGKEVCGKISGGESNIYAILRNWNVQDDWDRSIHFSTVEKSETDFDEFTLDWPYAGCRAEDLAQFIRNHLAEYN